MTTTDDVVRPLPDAADVTFRSVLVPLDGSHFAAEALATASALAARFDVPVTAMTVATTEGGEEDAEARALLDASGADLQVVVGDDVAEAILHGAEGAGAVVCLSTHGRGRVAGSLLGSVARDLLRSSPEPVVLVGPGARPPATALPRPAPLSVPRLVACVDGSEASEAILPAAAAWATALDAELTILTVAEPAPASPVPDAATSSTRRVGHLTARQADAYIADLAERWSGRAPTVTGVVALDPLSPAAGLEAHLRDHPAGLVAVSTHARRGLHRLWSGATASAIVHASTVPVLVVPVGA